MSKIMGENDLTGGQQFDPAVGETPEGEVRTFPDTTVDLVHQPDQGFAAVVTVISSDDPRVHTAPDAHGGVGGIAAPESWRPHPRGTDFQSGDPGSRVFAANDPKLTGG
jgi:hypothetical protein